MKFAKRNQVNLGVADDKIAEYYRDFSNLSEFIEKSLWANQVIQTKTDFSDMVYACAEDMARQNIIYRECMFNYTACYGARGILLNTVLDGFRDGLARVNKDYPNLDIRFIANLDRTATVQKNLNYLKELINNLQEFPLIAIGMDMQELGYPASNQAPVFQWAMNNGFKLTGHSGEEVGAESIWNVLENCNLDRIDHGVRAIEDTRLLDYLSQNKVLLTLCPESNVRLGVFRNWNQFPLKLLLSSGVKICINSDDPGIFNSSLTDNLLKCLEEFSLTEEEVKKLLLNPFKYNFNGQEYLNRINTWLEAVSDDDYNAL